MEFIGNTQKSTWSLLFGHKSGNPPVFRGVRDVRTKSEYHSHISSYVPELTVYNSHKIEVTKPGHDHWSFLEVTRRNDQARFLMYKPLQPTFTPKNALVMTRRSDQSLLNFHGCVILTSVNKINNLRAKIEVTRQKRNDQA